jgi:ribosomal protein S18 acetylase RimI-like enzyme
MRDAAVAIRVLSPTTDHDWKHAEILIAELKEWDVRQSLALGFDHDEVIDVFYPDGIDEIRRQSRAGDGCFAIAIDASVPAGCAGFRRLGPGTCELYDVYVRPEHRGRGIGSALVRRLLSQASAAGYEAMCLETASFMLTAHKLYRSLHFQVRDPYRSIPVRLADVTMWMECKLGR